MPKNNGIALNTHTQYAALVTVEGHSIGITYPGTIRVGMYGDYGDEINAIPPLPKGWESGLEKAIRVLQSGRPVGDILDYLPIGTLATYSPNGQNRDKIPTEIGLSEDVKYNIEKVVAIIELWLKRKLGNP